MNNDCLKLEKNAESIPTVIIKPRTDLYSHGQIDSSTNDSKITMIEL